MAKAQQTPAYRPVPIHLRAIREAAGLSQHALGKLLDRPQSWVFNCETAERRIDLAEFAVWCRACGADPVAAFAALLDELPLSPPRLAPHGSRPKRGRARKVR